LPIGQKSGDKKERTSLVVKLKGGGGNLQAIGKIGCELAQHPCLGQALDGVCEQTALSVIDNN